VIPPPEPEYEMRTYVLGFLYRGPNSVEDAEQSRVLQAAHLANIGRLAREGKIILAGPFLDKGDLRGVFLFDTDSIETAEGWCATDPTIRAGALRVELKPWHSAKGIMIQRPAAKGSRDAEERS
jgi:uncharacterized protein YciI